MPYKPKHCCQCGEKIERVDWKPWTSRRFCEFCATEYGIYDWIPRISGIVLALALFVISAYFQKSGQPLSLASNQFVSGVRNVKTATNSTEASPNPNINAANAAGQTNSNIAPLKSATMAEKTPDVKSRQVQSPPAASAEKTYFCGAPTKKGTPCSRRVKGGGRCWQHAGQAAMLTPEKLLADQ